ncbi:MAG: endonuclease/exonuclease/phosphatase family protein [Acidobacteria bacterium]|nr:endonuclease/exonuclease/phosphatase family protein [Acidobacteriota bacterium]
MNQEQKMAILRRKRPAFLLSAPSFAVCLLLSAFGLLPFHAAAQAKQDVQATLLESGQGSKLAATQAKSAPAELKLVSYNMRWRGGEELQQLIRLLREDKEIGGASVICLQEADRNKARTGNVNTARVMAESLGMYYAWAAPPQGADSEEEETGVAILSQYKLTEVERIVLPNEGPKGRRRVALGATAQIGDTPVRVYSVHAETRMTVERKVEHWRGVLEDLKRYPKIERVVVLGDFNTLKAKEVKAARQLFAGAGFTTPFPDERATWRTFIVELKLDWMWLRGLKPVAYGVDEQVEMSDHWPLWARVKLENSK